MRTNVFTDQEYLFLIRFSKHNILQSSSEKYSAVAHKHVERNCFDSEVLRLTCQSSRIRNCSDYRKRVNKIRRCAPRNLKTFC